MIWYRYFIENKNAIKLEFFPGRCHSRVFIKAFMVSPVGVEPTNDCKTRHRSNSFPFPLNLINWVNLTKSTAQLLCPKGYLCTLNTTVCQPTPIVRWQRRLLKPRSIWFFTIFLKSSLLTNILIESFYLIKI